MDPLLEQFPWYVKRAIREQLVPDVQPSEEDLFGDLEVVDHGPCANHCGRDFEFAFKVHEKIDQGLTREHAFQAVLKKYPFGDDRAKQIYDSYRRNFIDEYMQVLQQRHSEYRDRMDKALDWEMRILYPEPVKEALDLIEDDAVVGLPETRKRLKELEKATKLEEEPFMTVYATRTLHKMYWHGLKGQTAFTSPLWDRYLSALKRVVELNQTGRSNG